jgi:hypothetical protein
MAPTATVMVIPERYFPSATRTSNADMGKSSGVGFNAFVRGS